MGAEPMDDDRVRQIFERCYRGRIANGLAAMQALAISPRWEKATELALRAM